MRKQQRYKASLIPILIVFVMTTSGIAHASPGLNVSGVSDAIPITNHVTPGKTKQFVMEVSLDSADPPMDIEVKILGFGQTLNGTLNGLIQDEDVSPYSAVDFTTVSPESFSLEPGQSQEIVITSHIPQDIGEGGRYAVIHITSLPMEGGNVGMIPAVDVPILMTIRDSMRVKAGTIEEFTVSDLTPNEPVAISCSLKHTGNYHYKARAQSTLKNELGNTLGTTATPLTTCSILPTYSHLFETYLPAADEVTPGIYNLELEIISDEGIVIDSKTKTIEVAASALAPSDSPEEDSWGNWWPIVLISLVGLLMVVIIGMIISRSRSRVQQ